MKNHLNKNNNTSQHDTVCLRQRPRNPLSFLSSFVLLGTLLATIYGETVEAFSLIPSLPLSLSLPLNRFVSTSTREDGSNARTCCSVSPTKKRIGNSSPKLFFDSSSLVTRLKRRNALRLAMVPSLTTTLDPRTGGSDVFDSDNYVEENNLQGQQEQQQDIKVGVLLLNLGGPEKTQDVEGG